MIILIAVFSLSKFKEHVRVRDGSSSWNSNKLIRRFKEGGQRESKRSGDQKYKEKGGKIRRKEKVGSRRCQRCSCWRCERILYRKRQEITEKKNPSHNRRIVSGLYIRNDQCELSTGEAVWRKRLQFF